MAILAVFCGYFGYFAIMNPKYFEPKLVPNCCPKGTWYFPVFHTPCTFIPKLLEVLVHECTQIQSAARIPVIIRAFTNNSEGSPNTLFPRPKKYEFLKRDLP